MRVKVTDDGLVIPRELLEGVDEVEIRKEYGVVLVIPVGEQDPIWRLGKNPVIGGVTDASENLDKYIY